LTIEVVIEERPKFPPRFKHEIPSSVIVEVGGDPVEVNLPEIVYYT